MVPPNAAPSSLMIVRSTLEVATLLKVVYPAYEETLARFELEVTQAGQRMLSCHSTAQVHVELKRILQVRDSLDKLKQQAEKIYELDK